MRAARIQRQAAYLGVPSAYLEGGVLGRDLPSMHVMQEWWLKLGSDGQTDGVVATGRNRGCQGSAAPTALAALRFGFGRDRLGAVWGVARASR